jgi:hypothetical protein
MLCINVHIRDIITLRGISMMISAQDPVIAETDMERKFCSQELINASKIGGP